MNVRSASLLVLFALLAGAAPARAADPLAAARDSLQAAVDRADLGSLMSARGAFEAAGFAAPKSAVPRYWVALADWRALPLMWNGDQEKVQQLARDGVRHADEAIALEPGLGAVYALRAGLEGMLISLEPGEMMTLGPAAEADLARAKELAPEDPRVWIFDGIQALNKPAAFGGGVEPALASLAQAQSRFAAMKPGAPDAFGWGRDDAFVWAGRAEMSRQGYAAAVAFYRRALEANPANGWVAHALLPAAEKALKEGSAK